MSENKRKLMPSWMTVEQASAFRENIKEEDFKSFLEDRQTLEEECERLGVNVNEVNYYWHKSKRFSLNIKKQGKSYEEIRDDVIAAMDEHSPDYELIPRENDKDGHLLIVDPADVHIGKLASLHEADEYTINKARRMVKKGVLGLLDKVKGYNIEKIVFVGGNDILHIDSMRRTTTSGTPQDTDGMWFDAFQAAREVYVWCIETLIKVADVHFVFCPSNHDYQSGYFLADSIKSWFRKSKNFTSDTTISHRKYVLYGHDLIGFSHGDGAKETDLPNIMKTSAKQEWAMAKRGYWYLHHLHHKIRKLNNILLEKDYADVTVIKGHGLQVESRVHIEYLRSPSGTDSWHHRKGYEYGVKAVEAFLHHPENGQIARFSHIF